MTEIVIWDRDDAPVADRGQFVLWRSYGTPSMPTALSIPHFVELHSESLKQRYLAWVHAVGETRVLERSLIDLLKIQGGFSLWWMSPLVEKCNYDKSPWINDAIKLMAFDEWATGRTLTLVRLSTANSELAKCVQAWCSRFGVRFEWDTIKAPQVAVSPARRLYEAVPAPLRALAWLVRHLADRWAFRGVGVNEWRFSKARICFVSYLLNLVPKALSESRYESRYWADLPDRLGDAGFGTNWLHIYVRDQPLPSARDAARLLREYNRKAEGRQVHVALHSFLSVRVVLRAVAGWARVALLARKLERTATMPDSRGLVLWPMFRREWKNSMIGSTAMNNQLYLNLFHEALRQLPRQEKGVYLQENMDWEYAFLWAWESANHGTSIGCPHSTVRYWDLRYFFDPRWYDREGSPMPMPDKVAVNGTAALTTYREGRYPPRDLVEVEALRYLHLIEKQHCKTGAHRQTEQHIRLLVLGDYSRRHTELQMRLLVQAAQSLRVPDYISVIVKPHISLPIATHDYPELQFDVSTEPVAELLQYCDVAYTSAVTSAAVDAYCAGLPVIVALDPEFPNLSPLRGRDGVQYASTARDLADAIATAAMKPRAVGRASDYFRLDPSLPAWMRLLAQDALRQEYSARRQPRNALP